MGGGGVVVMKKPGFRLGQTYLSTPGAGPMAMASETEVPVQVHYTNASYTSDATGLVLLAQFTWAQEEMPTDCPSAHGVAIEGAAGWPWCYVCGWEYRPGGSVQNPGGVKGAIFIPTATGVVDEATLGNAAVQLIHAEGMGGPIIFHPPTPQEVPGA
jgi:hypothetical protein